MAIKVYNDNSEKITVQVCGKNAMGKQEVKSIEPQNSVEFFSSPEPPYVVVWEYNGAEIQNVPDGSIVVASLSDGQTNALTHATDAKPDGG